MKYFVFGDVHGYYNILMSELEKKGFDERNSEHMLISLGDNFDRGPNNYQMFLFLKEMKEKNKIILIKGNHEELLLDMIYRRKPVYIDFTNGTYNTVDELMKAYFGSTGQDLFYNDPYTTYKKLNEVGFIDFLYDMKDYYETKSYIFVHGFIPVNTDESGYSGFSYNKNWRNETPKEFSKSRWLNGIEMSINYNINQRDKKIVVGHFHASYGNVRKKYGLDLTNQEYRNLEFSRNECFLPYEDENVIAIDACTHFTKMVNVILLED